MIERADFKPNPANTERGAMCWVTRRNSQERAARFQEWVSDDRLATKLLHNTLLPVVSAIVVYEHTGKADIVPMERITFWE